MARRSQCSSAGDNPLDPNYLPPHYREEYRLAVDALIESGLDGYYEFLQKADVVDFLSTSELQYIQSSVQAPRQSGQPEQQQQLYLDVGGDGSSDTYWPVHSDLEVPGLDLGWPQIHAFMEPTEVTTLVNPPEPDMPSIKEQARRLIKNAQQVVAVAMDMFTDVDIFADLLNAAAKRVAVYILLDEQDAHHFVNMVANCRVNLDNFQFLRVRTVSGITYRCRSGRSFRGQMMDRFLLTDCRAVLSGNYSFMWSFEKLHRCMAHLFLGQFVTTFDEEFRILFAQSQPLTVENVLVPLKDLSFLQQKQYFNDNTSVCRDPRKFLALDSGHPDEWGRHSYDERMDGDRRMMALKKQDSLCGPADLYNRFASQQQRVDPCFDQGPSRMLMTENAAFKRHSFAEGVHGRYSLPFMQGMPESEPKGKGFHRGQQPYPGPAPESDYSGYDRFWNQDYLSADPYPEPGLPQEVPPPDFDPVLNYLSSTRNLDFDQSSEKFPPAADLPYASPRSKRRGLAQPYVCQTSPTPSSSAEQKQFLQDPAVSRKDPAVKQGLRNWRINSYLSAYENPEEEGLPSVPLQGPDAFEEPPRPTQQTAPGIDLPLLKTPFVKEFKVPAVPRPSQIPSYSKAATQEKPKMFLDEPAVVPVEVKVTPTPSESSTEGEKTEEMEPKEPKVPLLRREDSFRRQYNAAAQRSSRLRSSLIFSSLDQQQAPHEAADQPDEDGEKNKTEQTKLPFALHISGQRKPAAREPFEWSRFKKSTTETSKAEDSSKEKESKDLSNNPEAKETLKQPDVGSPATVRSKLSEAEPPKSDQLVQPTKPFLTAPLFPDMNDADQRFMYFKELAAKRKAAEAAKAEKKKDKAEIKAQVDLKNSLTLQKQEPLPKVASESRKASISESSVQNAAAESSGTTETCESASASLDVSENTRRRTSLVRSDSNTSIIFSGQEAKPLDSEKLKLDKPSASDLPVSAGTGACQEKSKEGKTESKVVKDSPSPSLARSMSFEAKLPETNLSAEPAKPLLKGRFYGDINDPYRRFMSFKQLSGKQKVDEAAKDKSEMKPEVDLKTSPVFQKKETLPKVSSESVKSSISEGLTKKTPVVESSGNTVSLETSESDSSSLQDGKNTSRKNSLLISDSCSGQENKEKTDLDQQSLTSLPVPACQRTSLDQTVAASPSPSMARSDSSEAEPPKTDQMVEPTKPIHADINNPYRKFLYFKEPAGKQKADEATEADKDKAEVKPQKEDPLPNVASKTRTALIPSLQSSEETMSTKDSLYTCSEQETKLSENLENRPVSDLPVSAGTGICQNKLSTASNPPFLARSKSSEAELPKTDQPLQPAPSTVDLSDTETRLTYFKELAAKRKAAVSEKERNKAEMKQEVNPKLKDKPLPNVTSENTNASVSEVEDVAAESSGKTVSAEASESASPCLDENTSKKGDDISQTAGDQETKRLTTEETGLPDSAETEACQKEVPEEPTVSDPFVAVPGRDETGSPPPQSTSEESVSDAPGPPGLHTDPQHPETKTMALLSELNTGSEVIMSNTSVPSSSSDQPSVGSQNNAPLTEDASSSGVNPEPKSNETSPKSDMETGSDPASSENLSADDSSNLGSDFSPERNASGPEPNIFPSTANCEEYSASAPPAGEEECEAPGSSEDINADSSSVPESGLLGVSDGERPDLKETVNLPTASSDTPAELLPSETGSLEKTSEDTPTQTAPSRDPHLTDSDAPTPAETASSEPGQDPEVKGTETNMSAVDLNSISSEAQAETEESEPTSEADLTGKTSESQTSEPTELESMDTDERKAESPEGRNKTTNTGTQESNDQLKQKNGSEPTEATSKQPKSSPSRYQSSTANVLSSSNLRDDTKLLLGQISANCQSRNESNHESPVTDDEKEDKNAQKEKGGRYGTNNRGPAKPNPEREKVLEKFESMRKEKRVYSRFMF
ncbi:protein FAM83H [Kryptolebias marmoratus]|uniref:Protein FAM83H-like n=1 Tax=Kryptolebias marmoratus TaxID=37003 RepID=A0A3Q3AJB1_KRYMA|nr:protein FAM83H [Kryptolebias marmoratus]